MDTSNSARVGMHFTMVDLDRSNQAEDRELATQCRQVVIALLAKLRPILEYIAPILVIRDGDKFGCNKNQTWSRIKALQICGQQVPSGVDGRILCLNSAGMFVVLNSCPGHDGSIHFHAMNLGHECWMQFAFDEVLEGIQQNLLQAEQMRADHLKAVSDRRQVLDQMMALLNK